MIFEDFCLMYNFIYCIMSTVFVYSIMFHPRSMVPFHTADDSFLSELIGYPFGPEYDRLTYNGYIMPGSGFCRYQHISLLNGSFPYFGGLYSRIQVCNM